MSELTAKRLKMYAPAPTPMAITLFTLQTEAQPHHMTLSIIAVFRQRNAVFTQSMTDMCSSARLSLTDAGMSCSLQHIDRPH